MALEFLAPITTPEALRSVQADSRPLITTILVIIALALEITLCWYIAFATRDPTKKREPKWQQFKGWFKK
ncbi:hypothetical protein N0V90_006241 [Kalmusia sp. IMI 367209]|nr:hypothetical protein N0V90_006241 [Kalmusia sp. IMI 367209]